MASVGKSLVAGLAIGLGWLLGDVILLGGGAAPALRIGNLAVSGAVIAAAVGFAVTFPFR